MPNIKKIPTIDIDNLTIVNPIDFLSQDENEYILEVIKQRLKDANNPDRWITWEEYEDLEKEKEFF